MAERVFIIAEIGSNWRMGTPERDRAMSHTLIRLAAEAGADAVKFQSFRPETVYVNNAGESGYLKNAGVKQPIVDIFRDLVLPPDRLPELAGWAEEAGVELMSSPFSVADLETVDPFVRRHKIASYEISHAPLIEAAASTGKPLILSTGAADLADVAWAIEHFNTHGGRDLTLMQCTARYPTPFSALNLKAIPALRERFGLNVGLSDHSRDPVVGPVAAVALGAAVIEKHITLDNRLPGPDNPFAITPDELRELVRGVRACEEALGSGRKEVLEEEQELFGFARRALQAVTDIRKGDILALGKNMEVLRPGEQRSGLHPRHLPQVEGKRASQNVAAGAGIRREDVEGS